MRIFHHKIARACKLLGFVALLSMHVPYSAKAAEIAVTLPPLAGLITMLDEKADVLCLLANGSDPHHFQLTPRKIEATQQTALLIRASKDDGGWPLPPHHARTLDLWSEIDHGWLSPAAVRDALPLIATSLIDLHPQRRAAIMKALEAALKRTHEIESEWENALAGVKKTGVLMQHPAWRRLMQAMDVPVLDVLETGHHGHEYGPRQLEHALYALNEHAGAWLIADQGESNRALDWLQEHAAVELNRVRLNALGTCSQSWVDLMRQNIVQFTPASKQISESENSLDHHHAPDESEHEHPSL